MLLRRLGHGGVQDNRQASKQEKPKHEEDAHAARRSSCFGCHDLVRNRGRD